MVQRLIMNERPIELEMGDEILRIYRNRLGIV